MNESQEGRCGCSALRYRITTTPLFTHCCHCTWCQRESGTAFALNALIESHHVEVMQGSPELILTPSNSGKGQKIGRCPECHVAVWSHYAGATDSISFIRVGTLDNPALFPPDIHIFVGSKLPWVVLPADKPAVEGFYRRSEYWPPASLDRVQKLREAMSK